MKVIEFAGLPGCGKSTLCNKMIESVDFNAKVHTYSDIVRFVSTKKRRVIYSIFVFLNPFRWKFLYLLKKFCEQYDGYSKGAWFVLVALYDICRMLNFWGDKHIVILDEGFVQNITSIPHTKSLETNDVYLNLINFIKNKIDIKLIHCYAHQDVVIQRLRDRGRKDRFNSIEDDQKLKEVLNVKNDNILTIVDCFTDRADICLNDFENSQKELLYKLEQVL